jgi:hypothetical protein
MNVFISWSGEVSRQLAEAVRDWLPNVLQSAKPYFTPADIEKGARWETDIAKALEEIDFLHYCFDPGKPEESLDYVRSRRYSGRSNSWLSSQITSIASFSF